MCQSLVSTHLTISVECTSWNLVVQVFSNPDFYRSVAFDSNFLEVERLKGIHRVSHEIKITRVNFAQNFQISDFLVVLMCCDDGIFQSSWSRVDDNIFFGSGIMTHEVALPRGDALADQCQLVISACR